MSSPRRSRQRRAERRIQRTQILLGSPEVVSAIAADFRCPDCDSEHGRAWTDREGITHHVIEHDDGCPYLTGVTS